MPILIAFAGWWYLGDATGSAKGQTYRFLNKAFTDNIVFEATAQSQQECALQCNQHDSCLTFTSHENTCTGHGNMSSCSASTPATGARSFIRKSDGLCERTGLKWVTNASLGLDTEVCCDGDWLVFQRRQDGSVDFYRNWTEYTNGFGDVHGEYWLGLENLHRITTSGGSYELRVEVMSAGGKLGTASYSNFSVGPAADKYRLNFDKFLGGNAGDSLNFHNRHQFSTFDAGHDLSDGTCAVRFHGAWWYNACHHSNLNGAYKKPSTVDMAGIIWKAFTSYNFYSLKSCQMMLKLV